jgi:hypothetical protein
VPSDSFAGAAAASLVGVNTLLGLGVLGVLYRRLLLSSVLPDSAPARGVALFGVELGFLLLVALTTTMTVPVVGTALIFSSPTSRTGRSDSSSGSAAPPPTPRDGPGPSRAATTAPRPGRTSSPDKVPTPNFRPNAPESGGPEFPGANLGLMTE